MGKIDIWARLTNLRESTAPDVPYSTGPIADSPSDEKHSPTETFDATDEPTTAADQHDEKRCGSCQNIVPSTFALTQKCPICGALWTSFQDVKKRPGI